MRRKYFLIKLLNIVMIVIVLMTYQSIAADRAKKEAAAIKMEAKTGQGAGAGNTGKAQKRGSPYKDGEYTGQAEGYGGTVEMKVKISHGKITGIETVSASGEDASYYDMAKAVIPKMVEDQSPDVDTVSGATYSSTGIINAVTSALQKAVSE